MKEPTLGNPQNTIAVLQKHQFTFQKKFGQNFLIDTHVLDKIIRSAEISQDDMVLEIGPGIGTMTQYLACAAGKVIAVEIDRALIPILEDTLDGYDNVRIINGDILKIDLAKLVEEGKISMQLVDDAVKRVLRIKFRLGLFDNPYTPTSTEKERFLLPQSLAIAEKLAEESIVLLKNENKVLPLANGNKPTIAVMGPLVENYAELLGSWYGHGHAEDVLPIKKALDAEFAGKAELIYTEGCDFDGNDTSKFSEALAVARKADIILLCMGEKKKWSGENASRSIIELPAIQEKFIAEMKKAGKPIVLALANGRPLGLSKVEPLCDAIVEMWQPGVPGGKPLAGVLSGRVNPSGKLSITFPRSTGQIPIYYNQRKTARPQSGKYQNIPSTPLYEFGYGLSYTTFNYGNINLLKETIRRGEKLVMEIPVTNVGKRDGAEVVHWFISDPFSTITRPCKELKHFEKQLIKAGETHIFRFEIDPMRDLGFVNANGEHFLENGEYYVIVKDQKVKFTVID